MEQQMIFSVSEANNFIKALLDRVPQLQEIFVRGEISNYKLYPSGHHYFTLKDAEGAMRCVLFKGNALRLRFRPENGMKVIAFDIYHLIAVFVVIYLKTFGIFQIHRGFISESVNLRTFFFFGTFFRTAAFCFFCICCILFRLPASGQCCRPKQHCTQKNAPQTHRSLFHFLESVYLV